MIHLIVILSCIVLFSIGAFVLFKFFGDKRPPLKVGDIVILSYKQENPYLDTEFHYETVTDIKTNDMGKIYFKSYTSDINGERAIEQHDWLDSHKTGECYTDNVCWIIVNHIK